MIRRIVCPALAVLVAAGVASLPVGAAVAGGQPAPGAHAGPPYKFTQEIMHGNVIPLKNEAMISKSKHGYVYRAGQQDSHLVVTQVRGGIRLADTGTRSLKKLPKACHRVRSNPGIAAICRVPSSISARKPLLLEVWPRLGNDYLNTSALPASFAATMLGDKGNDVAQFGAGRDFFNGYSGRDRVSGGAGNDWIRSGLDDDTVAGGRGNDDIVAVEGSDTVQGGDGADRLWAGDGRDKLSGGAGSDLFVCGSGRDHAKVEGPDHVQRDCESVDHA